MGRIGIGIIFFLHISIVSFCQNKESVYDSTLSDSIVYEYDTILNTQTIQHYVYSEPTHYNVVGIFVGLGPSWINSRYTKNPQLLKNAELFCSFSRSRTLFSTGIGVTFDKNEVSYQTQNLKITNTTNIIIDTISWFGQDIGSDSIITYITKQREVTKIDTQIIKTTHRESANLTFINVPIRFGYYIKNGYFRINVGLAFIPTWLVRNNITTTEFAHIIEQKTAFLMAIEPYVEATYWLSERLFSHFSLNYNRTIGSLTANGERNVHISSVLCKVGISLLFFDKKRE